MALPVLHLGWKTTETKERGTVVARSQQDRWSQGQPFDRPLPYTGIHQRTQWIIRNSALYRYILDPSSASIYNMDVTPAPLYNKAYQRFVQKCLGAERVELGINLATASLTAELLSDSFLAKRIPLERLFRAASKHDQFCRQLRQMINEKRPRKRKRLFDRLIRYYKPSTRDRRRLQRERERDLARASLVSFSEEYLKWHFAWSPLVKDMFGAASELHQDYSFNNAKVKASAKEPGPSRMNSVTQYPHVNTTSCEVKDRRVRIGAEVSVTNKVLFTLNNFGLLNPATVLWDLVPFSFVWDWFNNLSTILAYPTDLIGLSVKKLEVTYYAEAVGTVSFVPVPGSGSAPGSFEWDWIYVQRSTPSVVPIPQLYLEHPFSESWRRSVAQVSLLTLFGLRGGKTNRQSGEFSAGFRS